MRKGFSRGLEIVMFLVVAVIISVIIVVFASSNFQKGSEVSESSLNESGESIKYSLCKAKCSSCIAIHGDECSAKWSTFQGNDPSDQDSCPAVYGSCS